LALPDNGNHPAQIQGEKFHAHIVRDADREMRQEDLKMSKNFKPEKALKMPSW